MSRVFLSVGSNLGDRLERLRRAVDELRAMPDVRFLDASALYQTEPWEQRPGQPAHGDNWFFNCVVEIETTLDTVAFRFGDCCCGTLDGVVVGMHDGVTRHSRPRLTWLKR